MDKELKKYLDSLKDKEILVDHENPKDRDVKEVKRFVSIVCKTEENYVDFVRYIHFSKRDSLLFKNAVSRHHGATKLNNEIYQGYCKRGIDTTSELAKKLKI